MTFDKVTGKLVKNLNSASALRVIVHCSMHMRNLFLRLFVELELVELLHFDMSRFYHFIFSYACPAEKFRLT